jgi:Raf kinase inhibitor-like YbhB/YbcL family protein
MTAELVLSSPAFEFGQPIPRQYAGDGDDLSPPLAWHHTPAGTRELALICDDPDAPTPEPWVHWLIYKLPAGTSSLNPGMPASSQLASPAGALQGRNSWKSGRTIGYRGPAPPPGHGEHRYHFRLYALDASLHLGPGADRHALEQAMAGHIIGEALLIGTYQVLPRGNKPKG